MKNFLGGLALGLTLLLLAACYQYSTSQSEFVFEGHDVEITDAPKLPPVEERADPVVALDGYKRTVSDNLCKIAQDAADRMAFQQASRYRDLRGFHTAFTPATLEKHGPCRENICWVSGQDAWETAYQVWRASGPHEYNRQNGGHYIGYAKATSNGTHYYVVVYGSKP